MDKRTMGTRLREMREAKGVTQLDVAREVGVYPNQVSKWELDEAEPSITNLIALARFYGVTADRILGLSSA